MCKAILAALSLILVCFNLNTVHASRIPHCGCVNFKSCRMPCVACCGPHGMEDCFLNPACHHDKR